MSGGRHFTRRVLLETPEAEKYVDVTISKPRRYRTHGDWVCSVRFPGIMGGVNDDTIEVVGIDALDAIASSLGLLKGLIEDKSESLGWGVSWLAKGDNGGFDPSGDRLTKDAVPTLEKLAEHEDPQIAERAKAALRQIKGDRR